MLFLHKILPLIVSPLGLIVGLMFLAMGLRRQWPVYFATTLLLICSLPLVARLLWTDLESEYPYQPMSAVPRADAFLVLSGMLEGFETRDGYVSEWRDPDRFFVGVQLVKSGAADRLIFTNGKRPWSKSPPEGETYKQTALAMGISPDQILLTSEVFNTAEESVAVKDLMTQYGLNKVILVSSSFHLPRAKLLFDIAGVETYPYATDFKSGGAEVNWLDFIPNAEAFMYTSKGVREYIGRFYYWLKYA